MIGNLLNPLKGETDIKKSAVTSEKATESPLQRLVTFVERAAVYSETKTNHTNEFWDGWGYVPRYLTLKPVVHIVTGTM
jgi:DNA-binding protein H-NS